MSAGSRRRPLALLSTAMLFLTLIAALAPRAASAATTTLGRGGWQVRSSAQTPAGGGTVSLPGYATHGWLAVRPDSAGAVGTEVEALVQHGSCPDVFYGTNLRRCFGFMPSVGAERVPRFAVPWWFRTHFEITPGSGPVQELIVNGVVGSADVWVDGHEVASHAEVEGDFTRNRIDVSAFVHPGDNVVALEVHPNDPNRMLTLDNVDWTQVPPDNNTGIQFPLQLHSSGPLSLSDAHVMQVDTTPLTEARLTLRAQVTNHSAAAQTGTVAASVAGPDGAVIPVSQTVTVAAHATASVSFSPAGDPALDLIHPQVWWPYAMGAQPLYRLTMSVAQPGEPTDTSQETFGIRTVTTRLVGATAGARSEAPAGSRRFYINGRPILFRAGGWSENLLLHYSAADTAAQIQLIKNLGLNGIRIEGHEMPADFYAQMDRAGILIDAGFQCCDLWDPPSIGAHPSAHILAELTNSATTIAQDLRNHPSIMNFGWSDDAPTPAQQRAALPAFAAADFQMPIIASAEYRSAAALGASGEKEGPYDWVPPSYWDDLNEYMPGDPTRTDVGGAWAFNSEASAGATIPTLDFLRRWLTPAELGQLWTAPEANQYHLNYEQGLPSAKANGGYAFGTLYELSRAMRARYGGWSNLAGFVEEGQLANYEDVRAEFEAYIEHSTARRAPSTGIVYWQLNKGWPTLLWALYNADLNESGAYFGAQEANRPLHAIYDPTADSVSIANLGGQTAEGLSLQARVLDLAGHRLWSGHRAALTLSGGAVAGDVLHPRTPAETATPQRAHTYFVELILRRGGQVIDDNTYWESTRTDRIDWKATLGLPQATMTRYADLRELHDLVPASVRAAVRSRRIGPGQIRTTLTLSDPARGGHVAFFLRADLRRGTSRGPMQADGPLVAPATWSADDITLWPGETRTLTITYPAAALRGGRPELSLSGWNLAPRTLMSR